MSRSVFRAAFLTSLVLLVCSASPAPAQCTDLDGDGFYYEVGCGTERDCNDAAPTTYPGAPEVCDGVDNDCDGALDEGCKHACYDPPALGADVRVTTQPDESSSPSLVWTGSEYGLAWYDSRDGNGEIYFARLDVAGTKLGLDVRVTTEPNYSDSPSLVWTGSEYGLAWVHSRKSGQVKELYFARLDAAGAKLGPDVQAMIANSQSHPSLVWTGSEYGVAWSVFARFDIAGAKLGSNAWWTPSEAPPPSHPSLVWTGSEYGVAWTGWGYGNREIYFARLDSAGAKLGPDVRVTTHDSYGDSSSPSLVWAGGEYGVAWEDDRNGNSAVYFTRLAADGTKLGPDTWVTSTAAASYSPTLAWNGIEYGVAWLDSRDASTEISFARLDAAGTKLGPNVRVTNDAADFDSPALVWTGREYGLAWSDDRDGNDEIYFDTAFCCDPADRDADGFSGCELDCDDANEAVFPGADQVCDGANNDCADWAWPSAPGNESDIDADGFRICEGDCDDGNAARHPGAAETCNSIDDDCDGMTDELGLGADTDADGVPNACDNCLDSFNPSQSDMDDDVEGDACDLDDGMIYLLRGDPGLVEWTDEAGYDAWNVYAGDLAVLRSSGIYTQVPGDLAWRACGVGTPWVADSSTPPAGRGVFYLVTGVASGVEGSLGRDSGGVERPNAHPCL